MLQGRWGEQHSSTGRPGVANLLLHPEQYRDTSQDALCRLIVDSETKSNIDVKRTGPVLTYASEWMPAAGKFTISRKQETNIEYACERAKESVTDFR